MIVYGKQVVLYVLEKHPHLIEEVMFSKEIDKKVFDKFLKLGKKIIRLDNKKAQGLAHGGNHQGFFLRLKDYQFTPLSQIKNYNFILVFDGLTDVGNIGAITRTAYSLGADAIIASNVKSVNIEGAIRTSAGALLDMPFGIVPNIDDLVNELKQTDYVLVGAAMDGYNVKTLDRDEDTKMALFLGSEGKGISKRVLKKLHTKVSIPMKNEFDSLNVSVAAGILMHELI